MRLSVIVSPRSSENKIIAELPDGSLKIKLTAAPVDNGANEALVALLSRKFRIAKSKIHIIKGARGRRKLVEIED